MPLGHGIVPVGWAALLWDAEARDGAQLWHHPCAQWGANLIWNLHLHASRNTIYTPPCSSPVLLQVVNVSALKLFIDVVFCFKTK